MAAQYPQFFRDCIKPQEEALKLTVKSGMTIASGFATSEPLTFYKSLWSYIQNEDITDLRIKQALFMAPHPLCLGSTLQASGMMTGLEKRLGGGSLVKNIVHSANAITQKVDGLKRLTEHYRELQERRIVFNSAFIGGATNIILPNNAITKVLCPDMIGRNTSRMGITDMHSIHFPDAVDSMAYSPEGERKIDTFVMVMTPPNENGDMSHGPANGANMEILEKMIQNKDINLLLYVNEKYPFTTGYGDSPNTINVEQLKALADIGKLVVIEDEGGIPALPANSFDNPAGVELTIANNLVNHMELHSEYTYGKSIQVGFGSTGVMAIKALKDSSWTGRSYTEMLEPFTLDLYEAGKIKGSHFIEKDGRRTMLDGKIVCTFTICEDGSDFYDKINNNPNIVLSAASRVVIPEGFYGGLGINNCLSIDFYGHVNSGGRYRNHHSGIGGAAQINRGLAKGGVAYLCLKSTHKTPEGKLRSSVLPCMPPGSTVSLIGPDVMGGRDGARFFLVTEHGVARLSGQSQAELIKNLINVADPQFRDWLKHEAYKEFRVRV